MAPPSALAASTARRRNDADGGPIYKALAGELRRTISSGALPPHQRLPTEVELAAEWGVSRQTVRQAYAGLVAERLVYRVRGRGTFVSPRPAQEGFDRSFSSVDDLLALSLDTELEVVAPLEHQVDVGAAGRLHLPSDHVMTVKFRRFHEGAVLCFANSYLPVEIGRQLLRTELATIGARTPETSVGLVERVAGVKIAGAQQSISAVTATPEIAGLLGCAPDCAVLQMDLLYFDENGMNVELAVNFFNPTRYTYRLDLRRRSAP